MDDTNQSHDLATFLYVLIQLIQINKHKH